MDFVPLRSGPFDSPFYTLFPKGIASDEFLSRQKKFFFFEGEKFINQFYTLDFRRRLHTTPEI